MDHIETDIAFNPITGAVTFRTDKPDTATMNHDYSHTGMQAIGVYVRVKIKIRIKHMVTRSQLATKLWGPTQLIGNGLSTIYSRRSYRI